MHRFSTLALGLLGGFSALSSAMLTSRDATEAFNLFAYGPGIGGLPVIYIDGLAYIGQQNQLNSSVDVAIFSMSSTTLLANPNTTTTGTTTNSTTFSNATLYVPTTAATSRQAGFLLSNETASSDMVTTGWQFYGQTLLLVGADGVWNTLFYAVSTSTDGVWALDWNNTSEDTTAIPLTVKNNAPSNN